MSAADYLSTVVFLTNNPLIMEELVLLIGDDASDINIDTAAIRFWMELNQQERDKLTRESE